MPAIQLIDLPTVRIRCSEDLGKLELVFIPCVGARDEETAKKLTIAFKRGDMGSVRSLHRNTLPDNTCWCAGDGWWLSTAPND